MSKNKVRGPKWIFVKHRDGSCILAFMFYIMLRNEGSSPKLKPTLCGVEELLIPWDGGSSSYILCSS